MWVWRPTASSPVCCDIGYLRSSASHDDPVADVVRVGRGLIEAESARYHLRAVVPGDDRDALTPGRELAREFRDRGGQPATRQAAANYIRTESPAEVIDSRVRRLTAYQRVRSGADEPTN